MRTNLLLYAAIAIALTACTPATASSNATPTPSSTPSPTASPSSSATVTPTVAMVPAVVATRDIPASTQINADMITVAMFTIGEAPPYAFHSPAQVQGMYALIPIHAAQAITDNVVSSMRMTCNYAR